MTMHSPVVLAPRSALSTFYYYDADVRRQKTTTIEKTKTKNTTACVLRGELIMLGQTNGCEMPECEQGKV